MLPADKKCQRNRVQSGDDKKTNACQCEHLRHGPSSHSSGRGAAVRSTFHWEGIEPAKAGIRCQSGQSRTSAQKV